MSENTFDAKIRHIEDQYAARRDGAEAYRDQELGRLFVECKWTQQQIADRMGQSQSWVHNRLKLGAFLRFITTGNNSEQATDSLTERRFRHHWQKVGKGPRKETEEGRFARVLESLRTETADSLPGRYGNLIKKPGIKAAVIRILTQGKRVTVAEIVEAIKGDFPDGIDTRQVGKAVQDIQSKPPKGMALDARHSGRSHKYRLIHRKGAAVRPINPDEMSQTAASVLPKLEAVIAELKKTQAAMSVSFAIHTVWEVKKALEALVTSELEAIA